MRLQVQSLPLLSDQGSGIAVSCGVGRRCGSDPVLLWLWHGPVATAPIRPLAWEPPYAEGAALKQTNEQTNKNKNKKNKYTDQWNRIESPEINLDTYRQLIFEKGSNNIQMQKRQSFQEMVLGKLDSCV